jgi:hypothetical protein
MSTAKKGGSKIIWIIGGVIVIAGGVGAYFLLRKSKKENNNNDNNPKNTDNKEVIGSISISYKAPSELNSTSKIKAFQDWMDSQGKGWIKKDGKWVLLNKGAGYGNYGKSTDAVWKIYGKDYLKSLSSNSSNQSNSSNYNLSKDIETIVSKASGYKSQKNYLQKANSSFIQNWAKSILNNKGAFTWENQIYSTKNGEIIMDFNPIGINFYTSKSGKIAKMYPSSSSLEYYVNKGDNLGKATSYEYNNDGLWIYFPSSGDNYKWYSIKNITNKKTNSSFDGISEQFEFSAFDNNLDLNI